MDKIDFFREPFSNPIQLDASLFSSKQRIGSIEELEQWAERSRQSISGFLNDQTPYFDPKDLGVFSVPFEAVLRETKNYGEHVSNRRSHTALRNRMEKLLLNTIGKGTTFGHGSRFDSYWRNYQGTYARIAMLIEIFGIQPQFDDNLMHQIGANRDFSQGLAYTHLIRSRNTIKKASTASAKAITKFSTVLSELEKQLDASRKDQIELKALLDKTEQEKARLDQSITRKVRSRLKELLAIKRTANNYLQAGEADLKGYTLAADEQMAQLTADHNDQMDQIRKAFEAYTSLDGPSKYWGKRANFALLWAALSGIGFLLGAIGAIFAGYKLGPELYKTMLSMSPNQQVSLTALAIFSFPVIVALWMLKVFSRLFVENLHINQRARYKHMMITTYLSMLKNEQAPITAEERSFALQAIFEPDAATPNPITMPLEALSKLTGKD